MQLLGIGEAGHIGFNEPLSALMSRPGKKRLRPSHASKMRQCLEATRTKCRNGH